MLHEVAATLRERTDIQLVQIEGYADRRGDVSYNEALSARRAERVREWLVAHGIAAERLTISPRGEGALLEPGSDASAHLQTRRVVFRIVKMEAP
jgi:outer membrane protein OmpA-like peptidoglycan-associated protein